MFRLTLLIVALTYIPEPSPATTLADKLDKLYEKLEKLTVPPPSRSFVELSEKTAGHYAKLEETNSLGPLEDLPEEGLTEEEEAMLSGIEAWGGMSARQIVRLMKEIQEIRHRKAGEAFDKNSIQSAKLGEGLDEEASEDEDEMQDIASLDYAMDAEDGDENWDAEDLPMSTTDAARRGQQASSERTPVVDPVAATAERPRILDDSSLSPGERMEVRRSALANVERAVRADKCLLPQPRWLCIRQMAPAADTIYMPPCVVLHRCTVDSGCCYNEAETCGPIAGEYVAVPLYLSKADGNLIAARMLFYNHTRCSCISRDSEGQRDAARIRTESPRLIGDMQPSTSAVPVSSMPPSSYAPLMGVAELHTAPPELRRCTCPTLFMPRTLADGGCACTCRWAEPGRRRECLSLARGREHFGIRDRRCVIRGQCSPPACQYGPYDRAGGRCPPRPHRHVRSRYQKMVMT